jgi:ABC-2 type transport system permease protein
MFGKKVLLHIKLMVDEIDNYVKKIGRIFSEVITSLSKVVSYKAKSYMISFLYKIGDFVVRVPERLTRLSYYLKIWIHMSKNSFLIYLNQKKIFAIFLVGKLLRFVIFVAFLYFLVSGSGNLAGYNVDQVMFFFLTFNFVDIVSQFLFREVYRFRPLVVSGDLDLIMTKPMSSLFRVLMGGADIIDLATIPPLIAAMWYVGGKLNPTDSQVVLYLLLLANGMIIATAFHIAVLAFGIITLEIDHTIMIYRDLTNLGKLPIDIYKEPLRGTLTYLVPVGIMISLPVKTFLGVVRFGWVLPSFLLGSVMLFLSLRFWNYSLKRYSSASS